MDRRTSDRIDAIRGPEAGGGRLGAFAAGALLGLFLFAAFAIAVSLMGPGVPPRTGDVETAGTTTVASEEQMSEGEPFSAGPDTPAAEETAATEPDAETGEPATALEAPDAASETSGAGGGAAPVDEPVSVATGEPAATPTEDASVTDQAGGPVSVVVPQAGGTGEAASPAGAQPAGDTPGPAASAPQAGAPGEQAAATAPDAARPAETEADTATPAPPGGSLDVAMSAPASTTAERTTPSAEAEAAALPPGPALVENATPFRGPRQAPLLAVVLVGEDVGALTAERLSLIPMPLTVAIPPELPGAAGIGAAARANGHEVLVDLSLVEGSEAGDAVDRVASLDMAVGATATELPADTGELEAVLAEMGRHGLAWVEHDAGIVTPAERIARELGVAYTEGDRGADGDKGPDELYRAIDAAAAQALRRGTSVLFLDAGEPTLQGLVQWGLLQPGDNPVWFAPISAVIERRDAM